MQHHGSDLIMGSKNLSWLFDELSALVREGVIDEAAAGRIKSYYEKNTPPARSWALTMFGLLGGLLVGLGIILLLAHNWEYLPRAARTALAYVPLVIAQAGAWFVLNKKNGWSTRAEGVAMFWSLSVATVIAMVSQIYHMPGDAGAFVLTWMLLTLPVMYLMKSISATLVYLAGITYWAGNEVLLVNWDFNALWFWPLWLAALPLTLARYRSHRSSAGTALLLWGLSITAGYGLLITLSDLIDAWWQLLLIAYFAVLYLADKKMADFPTTLWKRPGYVIGGIGCVVLSFIFSFDGNLHAANLPDFETLSFANKTQFGIVGVLFLIYAGLLGSNLRSRNKDGLWVGVIPFLVLAGMALAASGTAHADVITMLTFNVFLFALGLAKLIQGFRQQLVGKANAGLAVLFALIVVRFFDADIGFILKGLVFIALGAAFMVANVKLARRRREAA